jgi:hypothetical protein
VGSHVFLLVIAIVQLSLVASAANDLGVKVTTEKSKVVLSLTTVAINPAMCSLKPTGINVDLGAPTFEETETGKIQIQVARNSAMPCLQASGPDRGKINFATGRFLPELPEGTYDLEINKQSYGKLVVDKDSAKLTP